ncbi:MAG: MATE family efflux transporter [Rhodothermales bacterium]|nr:MATE family efflux transporter [Rhodothermales bacterium]
MMTTRHSYRAETVETLKLAGPIVVTQIAHISLSFVDTVMVGRLGAEALAGISLGSTLFFNTLIFCMGVLMAVGPMVSQAFGAKEADPIGRSVRQGLWLAAVLTAAASLVLWNAAPIYRALGQEAGNIDNAVSYLRAIGWGIFPFLGFVVLRSFMEAVNRPRTVTAIAIGGVALNAFLNWVLMFGKLGFPEMGLVGTGWASTIVYSANFIVLLVVVARRRAFMPYNIFRRLGHPDPAYFRELFRIGWPIGASMGIETSLFMITVMMMGWISTTALAAHQVAIQCAAFTFMVPLGIGMASSVRVGQAAGRRDPEGVSRAGRTGMLLSIAFMCGAALAFWLAPRRIVGLYLDLSDPANAEVVRLAASLLGVAAVFQVVDGLQVSAMGALRGLKDTRRPMMLAAASYWGIGLTGAWLLGFVFDLGEVGLWWGLVLGLAAAAVLLSFRFEKLTARFSERRRPS